MNPLVTVTAPDSYQLHEFWGHCVTQTMRNNEMSPFI